MTLTRWRSKQWWLTRSCGTLVNPPRFEFAVNAGGDPVKTNVRAPFQVRVFTLKPDTREVDEALWDQIVMDVEQGAEVPIYELFLLDANYFLAEEDLRQVVIQVCCACEYLKEITFCRKWEEQNFEKKYSREKTLRRSWDLSKHLDEKFYDHFRRWFKVDHPAEWELIQELHDARNNVTLGGPLQFGDPPTIVDKAIAGEFLNSGRQCVDWLLNA